LVCLQNKVMLATPNEHTLSIKHLITFFPGDICTAGDCLPGHAWLTFSNRWPSEMSKALMKIVAAIRCS